MGDSFARPSQPIYRPGNSGSILHGGSVTTPGGSTIGAVRGPRGGGAAGIVGPGGGAAGAIRGPRGGGAAGIVGPGGAAAGAVRGPGGRGVAGARGPGGNRYVTNLPAGAARYPWGGGDYWHVGYDWWQPYWVGDSMYYGWAYPPLGYYYSALPDDYETVIIENQTYYESGGVYYQDSQQDGQSGFAVVEAPVQAKEQGQAGEGQAEDPFAILKRMGDYIGGLPRLGFTARTTHDQLGESDEKIQLTDRRNIIVERPSRVAVEVKGDVGDRRVVYDGKAVSMLDRGKNVYTVVPVPDTIDAALDKLAVDYNVIVPLEDLLYQGLYDRLMTRIVEGQYLGLHKSGGASCHHLAFTTDTSTWEIWIDAGDKPILRKLVIDYGQDINRLRYAAEITDWTDAPTVNSETFGFSIPADARRFELSPVTQRG